MESEKGIADAMAAAAQKAAGSSWAILAAWVRVSGGIILDGYEHQKPYPTGRNGSGPAAQCQLVLREPVEPLFLTLACSTAVYRLENHSYLGNSATGLLV